MFGVLKLRCEALCLDVKPLVLRWEALFVTSLFGYIPTLGPPPCRASMLPCHVQKRPLDLDSDVTIQIFYLGTSNTPRCASLSVAAVVCAFGGSRLCGWVRVLEFLEGTGTESAWDTAQSRRDEPEASGSGPAWLVRKGSTVFESSYWASLPY